MKPLEVAKYLFDIREACERLRRFTGNATFKDYDRSELLQSAVERQFEIIGEALNQVLKLDPALADAISRSADIVAFRNRLIHGYASVSNEVVWGVLESQLDMLEQEVSALLGDHESTW